MQARPERRQTPPGRLLGPARGRRRTRAAAASGLQIRPPRIRRGLPAAGVGRPRKSRGARLAARRHRAPTPSRPNGSAPPVPPGGRRRGGLAPSGTHAKSGPGPAALFSGPPHESSCAQERAGRGLLAPILPGSRVLGAGRRAYGMGPRRDRPSPLPPFDRIFRRAGILRSGLERGVAGRSLPGHLLAGVRVTPADKTDIYRRGGVAPDKMHLGSRPRMPQRPAAVPGEAAA